MSDFYVSVDPETGELKHYGVLGMKWGVRRARKKGTTYSYKSHATKVYEKKANKALKKGNTAKAEKYSRYSKRSADLDKKMQSYAEKTSVGKAVVQKLVGLNTRDYAVAKQATGNRRVTSYFMSVIGDMPIRAWYVRKEDRE